jgi:hypothetical protein
VKIGCRPCERGRRRFARCSSTYLSDPGRDEAVVRGPKIVKKGVHLGPLNEGERARKTRATNPALTHPSLCLTLLVKVGSVKAAWCG